MSEEPVNSAPEPAADSTSRSLDNQQPKKSPTSHDPLHGVTLENMLSRMVAKHGWEELGAQIPIRCFLFEPSVKSSLKFLRRTPWARKKVEDWYAYDARRFPMEQYDADPPTD